MSIIMSPHEQHNIDGFAASLVQMARAVEELPGVKQDLSDARGEIDRLQSQVQRLELRLIDRANEIDTLNVKVREAEKARDDAETMFLETDERLSAFRHLVSGFSSNAASLLRAQEPEAKPEPTPITQAELDRMPSVDADGNYHPGTPQQGQSDAGEPVTSMEATPASADIASTTSEPAHSGSVQPKDEVSVPVDPTQATESSSGSGSEGSARHEDWARHNAELEEVRHIPMVDPTAPSTDGNTAWPASAAIDGADTVADAPASAEEWKAHNEPAGPYAGRKWSEVSPRVYNYGDWERGGGSSENFNL